MYIIRVGLQSSDEFCWSARAIVLKDVCRGMVYLHSATLRLYTRTLSRKSVSECKEHFYFFLFCSLNILLDSNGNGKIGDFGFSWELPEVAGGRSIFTAKGFAISKEYHADELTYGKCSTKSDVYSYGIVRLTCIPMCASHLQILHRSVWKPSQD